MSTTLYGASDDLIELDGDVSEEFSAPSDDVAVVAFSNGVLVRIRYDEDGIWRITPLAGGARVQITQCTSDGEGDDYSDRAVIDEPVSWVVCGTAWAKP